MNKQTERANKPQLISTNSPEYREAYANSVQVRASLWDLFLLFGTTKPHEVGIEAVNFQGIYISPAQAKALLLLLQQNVSDYEKAFGEIQLKQQAAQA